MTENKPTVPSAPLVTASPGPESWILKTPNVCGGDACIRNTRITVWGLVNYRRLGLADSAILSSIAGLVPADLDAAWEYYDHHREETDRNIRENEEE